MTKKNPFNEIDKPLKEVPKELKAKVMRDIAMAKLVMETAALFSTNALDVLQTVLKKRSLENVLDKEKRKNVLEEERDKVLF